MRFTIEEVAAEMAAAGFVRAFVERLGGNVYGLTDYAGNTVTINGGQLAADTEVVSAEVLICRDGAEVVSAEVWQAREIPQLVAMSQWRTAK